MSPGSEERSSAGEPRPGARAGGGLRGRERLWSRALAVGLAGSLLVHLALLLTLGRLEIGRDAPASAASRPRPPEGPLVILFELAPPEPEEPAVRTPEEAEAAEDRPPAPRPAAEGPPRLPAGEPVEEEGGLTNAERLQPRMGDERLWVDFRHPIRPGSITRDRYAEAVDRLRQVVRVWLDSLQLSEDQRRRALDWTFGEGESRWGISPEGLHLGDVTIPIPFGALFQQGGPLGRDAEQAVRDLQEIRAQDARQAVDEVLEERREEMRRRSQEEAERRRRDSTEGGG